MIKALVILMVVALVHCSSWDNGGNLGSNSKDDYSRDDYSQPIPYQYGYDVKDDHGLQLTREEHGDGNGAVRGSYSYRTDHGIERRVEYVADKNGFRAVVKTNEPGTAKSRPADVEMVADPIIVDTKGWSDNRGKSGLW